MSVEKLRRKVLFSLILILVGISLLLNDYVVAKREKVFSATNLELTEIQKEEEEKSKKLEEAKKTEENKTSSERVENNTSNSDYETYAGILEIPKINFNKGFYRKDSSLNNVKFNLKILDSSSYPDEKNGNTIIIGHSGNYSNSYFGNLYQLVVGDTATITYENKKYTYKVVNIYNDTKDGTVTIYRDESKTCLTLITCTKDDETKQTIYIFELESVQ